ncbi:MAG: glycosyltransferase [Bacteroidetes bacterium]|nr:glycosyltransferase [Bacteroidota bacterium]
MNILIYLGIIIALFFVYTNFKFLKAIIIISSDEHPSSDFLKFSIVIAIKNEAENIPGLIISIKKLFYPKDFYEVIIIDDNSDDDSYQIINDAVKKIDNIKLYKVGEKKYPGKKGALEFGVGKASNPYIVITDGDCLPQKNWLISFASKFSQGYDVVFGASPFIKTESLINKISCFENLRTTILTFTAATYGLPYSASARSFGFTKNIYEHIGGYKNTTDTLSGDDDLFIREAIKQKAKIGCFIEKEGLVFTNSVSSFKDYLQQKARHTSTSFYYLPKHKYLLGVWHLSNLFFLILPFLFFINIFFSVFFIFKFLTDIVLIKRMQKLINYNFNPFEIIYLQIIYELLLIVNIFNSKFSDIKWKG